MNQLVEYRHEVVWSNTFRSWKEDRRWPARRAIER